MTRILFALTVIGFVQISGSLADEKERLEKDCLDGTWKLASLEINGEPLSMETLHEAKLVVHGPKYSLTIDDSHLEMTHVLRADKKRKELDLTIVEGEHKGEVYHAIYKLAGDKFTVCRNIQPGMERPKEFVSKPNTGVLLGVWVRQEAK
jgi:uncharacterized protein (TIGR03067 family)